MAKKRASKTDLKSRILEAALPDVVFDGWSDELLARAAERLKISEDDVDEAFPGGPQDMVAYFSEWANARMLEKMTPAKLSKLRVRDKIAFGVRTRLEILAPHKQAVASALAFMAPPPRNLQLPKLVWKTADAIWRAAGDTATDYNHYTKRLLLSGVLTSTTLYWLNDKSGGDEKTWAFLDRRIDNVLKIGQALGKLKPQKSKSSKEAAK